MKIVYCIVALVLSPLMLNAQNEVSLCIYTKGGTRDCFLLQNQPKIIVVEDGIEISTTDATVLYPLDKYIRFTVEDTPTIPTTSLTKPQDSTYTIKGNSIITNGLINVFDFQGRIVCQSTNGNVNLSNIPKGVYIVKTQSLSFKIIKK